MKHRMIILLCSSQGDSFEIDRESSDSTREQTPDSDSGYMASCVTVVSTTSSQSKTFPQPRPKNNSKPSGPIGQGIQSNNEGTPATVFKNISASSNNRPNFLAEMQSAQKRRLSKDNLSENESLQPNTSSSSHKDVPKRNLPVIPHDHSEIQNTARANSFTNSLADQLKIRLEERRKNSDESESTNLAADVQKAVNIANESSKYKYK